MADEAVAEPASRDPQKPQGSRSPEAPPRGGERGGDRGGDRGDEQAQGEAEAHDGPEAGDDEAAERAKERERAADRIKDLTRDPLAEEDGEDGPTDLAAAARARRAGRKLLTSGRDFTSFDRSRIGHAHIGDINVSLDARRSGVAMRGGPVPEEELRRLRRAHVEPAGYVRLRRALESRRLLVLGGAPGTGRTSTALALLDEVTRDGAGDGGRVRRVDPHQGEGVRGLVGEVNGGEGGERRGTGYLLELALDRPGTLPPDEMDLDQLASTLAEGDAYAVVVVSVGSAANPLLAGRYGMVCPPAPSRELVTVRLRERLEEARGGADHGGPPAGARSEADRAGALERAARIAEDPEVIEAVGLDDLRPAEAELLASLLAEHLLGSLTREELLSGCRSIAAVQAHEWFAGVDRALAGPSSGDGRMPVRSATAALFHPVAFRIALAVLGGGSHSAVSAAAHLLTWELSVQSDPDSTPSRPLFCDDPESDRALSRARPDDGAIDVAGAEVTGQLIFYRGSALPAAVLAEIWDRHFPVRAPVVRWLRLLADDPRPQVSVRAAVAAGELSVRDFEYGFGELVRPLAEASSPRRRVFAATALDQVAGHATHRKAVRKVVDDWSRYGTASLRWTAAMALGHGRAADSVDAALDALARIGVRDQGRQLAVASLNVVRLLTLPECATVLRRLGQWAEHRREEYQDLALVTIVRLATTGVDEVLDDEPGTPLGDRGDWPLLLALAVTRPELTGTLADLLWTALNTARSRDVAFDALEALLRSASRGERGEGGEGREGREGGDRMRPGLAALLPALTSDEHDRQQLEWLLRRMMRDQDRPLTTEQASALWRLAVPARQRRSDEEESHG
ncbi:hypothetical protein ACFWUT_22270 [Streptomyces cyaneofuscatus]|uniref:hypothetical protein n=1 Tax=Streptomyces cyaneofuscatus TaxID=66883 RepID=UPI00364DDF77